METMLLASALRDRADYELVAEHINAKLATYSKAFQVLMSKIGEYYARDGDAKRVLPQVLVAQIAETIRSDKHIERFTSLLEEAAVLDYSTINVRATIIMAKQREVGDQLAIALTSNPEKAHKLLEEYQRLSKIVGIEELQEEKTIDVFHNIDLEVMLEKENDPSSIIKIFPKALTDKLDGGAKRGHHITIFARPETGKTATCITASCGFLMQGLRVLYVINEDRPQDLAVRHISCLTGLSKHEIYKDISKASRSAETRGFSELVIASAAPGTPQQIRALIDEHEPDCVIVDQLRNLKVKSDNRVNQLEAAATECRNIAKQSNVLLLSVTQAGDSASDKVFLDMGDVDFSNTGIPAQADVMIGIGVNAQLEAEGRRGISLCKNKLSGEHAQFIVNITPSLSRLTSIGE